MIAVTMPVFVWLDFLDSWVGWVEHHLLIATFVLAGTFALGMVSLVLHDTRHDDRSELDDTAPKLSKVVRIDSKARVYTDEDYRHLIAAVTAGEDPKVVMARIGAQWDEAQRELRDNLNARRKKEAQ